MNSLIVWKRPPRAGEFWAIRMRGDNGDLIVGQVMSIRSTKAVKKGEKKGSVVCKNLLTDHKSTKDMPVFVDRNKRVSKQQAMELVDLWNQTKDKKKVREAAVLMPEFSGNMKKDPPYSDANPAEQQLNAIEASIRCIMRDVRTLHSTLIDLQFKLLDKSARQKPKKGNTRNPPEGQTKFVFTDPGIELQ